MQVMTIRQLTSPEHVEMLADAVAGAIAGFYADCPVPVIADSEIRMDGQTAITEIRDARDGTVYQLTLTPLRAS